MPLIPVLISQGGSPAPNRLYTYAADATAPFRGPVNPNSPLQIRINENSIGLGLSLLNDDFTGASATLVIEGADGQGIETHFTGQTAVLTVISQTMTLVTYGWPSAMPAVIPGRYYAYFIVTRVDTSIWTTPSILLSFLPV